MFVYFAYLMSHGADFAFRTLQGDLSDGYTWATLSPQGRDKAISTLIGFASRA